MKLAFPRHWILLEKSALLVLESPESVFKPKERSLIILPICESLLTAPFTAHFGIVALRHGRHAIIQ